MAYPHLNSIFLESYRVCITHLQINSGISLNHSRNQWVDLGILNDVCMTDPETCVAAGGAVAFWTRRHLYDRQYRTIILARARTGFRINCHGNGLKLGYFSFVSFNSLKQVS